jgi:hypothetical protein
MATADQLAMLRATAEGEFERAEEMSHALRGSGGLQGYPEVIAAAFYIAVRKQFPDRYCAEDVIRLVADTRAMFDQTGDALDPRAAELVTRSALGEQGLASHLSGSTISKTQVAVVSWPAHEKKLGDQFTLLRAMVEGDFDRHEQLAHTLRDSGGLDTYGLVIGAAFRLAVRQQFDRRYSPDDVIRLVADTRMLFDRDGDTLDPRAAELLVRSALGGHGRVGDLPGAKKVEIQVAVCSYLAHERRLGEPDVFIDKVEALVADWSK